MLPTPLNVHRLLLSGVLVAAKLTDDHYYNNAFYGRVRAAGLCRGGPVGSSCIADNGGSPLPAYPSCKPSGSH